MQSIDNIRTYFKRMYRQYPRRFQDALIVLVIILVGISSFSLGFLAGSSGSAGQIHVSQDQKDSVSAAAYASQQQEESKNSNGQVVASKNADHYHLPWCPGAQQINKENKIYFKSPTAAEANGYEPAANCPELSEGKR